MALDATIGGISSNAYLTVSEADTILEKRLYTTAWDAATSLPSGWSVTTEDPHSGHTENGDGDLVVVVDGGEGDFAADDRITFDGDANVYIVASVEITHGYKHITLTTPLVGDRTDGQAITLIPNGRYGTKERAIMTATAILDQQYDWYGTRNQDDQALRWPRNNVADPDGNYYLNTEIPELLKVGVAEYAMWLLANDPYTTPSLLGQGFSEAQLGPMKIKVDSKNESEQDDIPRHVIAILSSLGTLEPEAQAGGGIFNLIRS